MFFKKHHLFSIYEIREFEKEAIMINCIFHYIKKRKFLTKEMCEKINSITLDFNSIIASFSKEPKLIKRSIFHEIKKELQEYEEQLLQQHIALLKMERTKGKTKN